MSIRDDLFDLTDKVALVTGASRGLGQAMALALAQNGCHVAINAREGKSLGKTAQQIEALGRRVLVVAGDVSDEDFTKKMVDEAAKVFGRIDILVNNAGIWEGTYFFRLKKSDWDNVIRVNMTGAFLVAKAVSRVMMKQRSGKIINVSSVSGFRGSPEALAYCATKGALIQMTRVMAIEMGPVNVQVNAVAPGMFDTDMTKEYIEDKAAIEPYLARVPSKRYGQPKELAGLVIFLASKASDHMTGQIIALDGGASLV